MTAVETEPVFQEAPAIELEPPIVPPPQAAERALAVKKPAKPAEEGTKKKLQKTPKNPILQHQPPTRKPSPPSPRWIPPSQIPGTVEYVDRHLANILALFVTEEEFARLLQVIPMKTLSRLVETLKRRQFRTENIWNLISVLRIPRDE